MSFKDKKQTKSHGYRFIDLFAGIGGFHLGLEQTGRANCVFTSEWDEAARKTYEYNFRKTCPELFTSDGEGNQRCFASDITKVAPESIPDFDIVCGGFPCQPFSQAGHKRGFSDTRGTLFFNVEEIIRVKRPAAFFLENVRGLITHGGPSKRIPGVGKTMEVILDHLFGDEKDGGLGYFAPAGTPGYFYVKASDFGVPQHRPRVFIIGFRDKEAADCFRSPIPRQIDDLALSRVLAGSGGRVFFDAAGKKLRKIGFTLRCGGKGSAITDRRNWDHYYVQKKGEKMPQVMRINEKQGLALNGFPKTYKFPKGVPVTARMKQLGNSVAAPAVAAWAKAIINALDRTDVPVTDGLPLFRNGL